MEQPDLYPGRAAGARQMIQEKVMRTALTNQVMLTVEEINQAVTLTLEEETE